MNAVGRGAQLSQELLSTDAIVLGERIIVLYPSQLTFHRFMEIGREAAQYFYRSQDSIEGFMMGWLDIGRQRSETIHSGSLSVKESHVDAMQTLPDNVIQFKSRGNTNE